ncbi:MAG TPA: hypothetical protein VJK51_00535 [Candidatus Nanoarchaeia archaeon]|nr:hypothetical protein [Candidatus Nanoarchaeia archaeon]
MFGWLFGTKKNEFEEQIKKSFSDVKDDMDKVGDWLTHLDQQDKQLFSAVSSIKEELSSIREELGVFREEAQESVYEQETKQVFKKLPVLGKQMAVLDVQEPVQTAVQTGTIYDILKSLSGNERLIVYTILNSDMKLSYEDLALMLGKERATIRGQVNAIKQKAEGLLLEQSEKNGKKRVFIPADLREKLAKYAKVRVKRSGE